MRDVVESWLLVNHDTNGFHKHVEFADVSGTPPTITANNLGLWNDGQVWKTRNGTGSVTNLQDDIGAPAGSILMWPTGTAPTGWLLCNGQAVSRTTYAALFAIISTDYGVGDGSTTFNLPDFRGEFVRGTDNAAGNDPDAGTRTDRGDGTTGDSVGTKQASEYENHSHGVTDGGHSHAWTNDWEDLTTNAGTGGALPNQIRYNASAGPPANDEPLASATTGITVDTSTTGGTESRGRNIGMNFIIRT